MWGAMGMVKYVWAVGYPGEGNQAVEAARVEILPWSVGAFCVRGFVACAGREGLLGLDLVVGFGGTLRFRRFGLWCGDVGCQCGLGCRTSGWISGGLDGFCGLVLDAERLKRSSGREEEIMMSYVEALLGGFERYMKLHVKMR